MAIEETLVLVKPDGVARSLTGEILARIEAKGYSLVDIRLVEPDREIARARTTPSTRASRSTSRSSSSCSRARRSRSASPATA